VTASVQRSQARFVTVGDGWVGRYCFSYDEHYDAANVSFEELLACNEFVVEAGAGFGLHRHAGIDIVTVVLSGEVEHVTAAGVEVRGPGTYVLPTGAGVEHDERASAAGPARFVQAFLVPGAEPRPRMHELAVGERVEVAGPAFAFVTAGGIQVGAELLGAGDSFRAAGDLTLVAAERSDVLVWSFAGG
jgi:hypothetical protein